MSRILIARKDWRIGKDGDVWVHCPVCDTFAHLSHEISDNGEVNPSIWHQCGEAMGKEDWHIYGTLEGWTPLTPSPTERGQV